MQELLKIQKKLIPEMVDLLEKRYGILRAIFYNSPIGRRGLANMLNLGERIVRTEINFLKEANLIEINTQGMNVTDEGKDTIEKLKSFIHEIKGLSDIEQLLGEKLNVNKVIVVPGDLEDDENVLKEIGKAAANYTKDIIKDNDVIAITGGSTIKEVVDSFPKVHGVENVLVVPARGGMGKNVETQANTLAAILAKKVSGNYKMLHISENLSKEVLDTLIKEEGIREIIDIIKHANVLIYGIGSAEKMATKRGVPEEMKKKLNDLGAIGEAFGCYFNANSEVVSFSPTVGISVTDAKRISTHIAVAGGKNKVEAIMAATLGDTNAVLVTDEGAAEKMIELLQ